MRLEGATCPTLLSVLNARLETAMRVLISIDPRAYSQTIGYTVRALKPHYAMDILDPDLLRTEVERHSPDLVLCSLSRPVALGEGLTWVEFRHYARPGEQISVNDWRLGLESVEFTDPLSILDEAESLRRCA